MLSINILPTNRVITYYSLFLPLFTKIQVDVIVYSEGIRDYIVVIREATFQQEVPQFLREKLSEWNALLISGIRMQWGLIHSARPGCDGLDYWNQGMYFAKKSALKRPEMFRLWQRGCRLEDNPSSTRPWEFFWTLSRMEGKDWAHVSQMK